MKIFQLIKSVWAITPVGFFINLLARIFVGSMAINFYEGVLIVEIIITLWMLSPLYYSLRNTYYEGMGTQTWGTMLWNDLTRSIHRLEKASKNRIKQTKLRMWVEKNPEIHILNYWYLKILRRKEWINLDVEEEHIFPEYGETK